MRRPLVFLTFLAACTAAAPGPDGGDAERGNLGKADIVGSCEPDDCGGPASVGTCWCDDYCQDFGDCCDDKVSVCEPEPETECRVGGCSGQLCVGPDDSGISTCEFLPWYQCFDFAECGNFGPEGSCGWNPTPEFEACMDELMGGGGDDACGNPPEELAEATPVEFELYEPPAPCFASGFGQFLPPLSIENAADFRAEFGCPDDVEPDVDFETTRIQRVVIDQNPSGDVAWAVEKDGAVVVGTVSDPYCGGAAPPDTVVYITLPRGGEVVTDHCLTGTCPPCGPFGCPP